MKSFLNINKKKLKNELKKKSENEIKRNDLKNFDKF